MDTSVYTHPGIHHNSNPTNNNRPWTIHHAAYDGGEAEVVRLVQEGGQRLSTCRFRVG